MIKLVINIPCYNEEGTLPQVVSALPDHIPGIQEIHVQIVDDGSTDQTKRIAQDLGCKVISHKSNLGLGRAFQTGVTAALESGCDIFVNLDADNQYPTEYIEHLIQPILKKEADIVIGNRQPWKVQHFSMLKRVLQWTGNGLIRVILNIDTPDAVSGFRAYSRVAMKNLHVTSSYSYTLDTLIQAAHQGLRVRSLIIHTNPPTRDSRLSTNIFQYIALTMLNFVEVMLIYEPKKLIVWGVVFNLISLLGVLILISLFS